MKLILTLLTAILFASDGTWATSPTDVPVYPDGRPSSPLRLEATDQGVVLKHGDGPGQCDMLGARDIWVYEDGGTYYMHYDGAGSKGWLACLATSTNLVHWTKKGPVLDFGKPDEDDSASASYGTTYFDGTNWQMFYLGTRRETPAPNFVPCSPYVTMKAVGSSPNGPWMKQPAVVPFRCQPGTYFSDSASPGYIVKQGDEYLMFFSAAKRIGGKLQRTLGIARETRGRTSEKRWLHLKMNGSSVKLKAMPGRERLLGRKNFLGTTS